MIQSNKLYLFFIVLFFIPILDISSASSDWQDREDTYTQLANCFIEREKCDLERYPFSSLPFKKRDVFKGEGTLKKIRSWEYYNYVGKGFLYLSPYVKAGFRDFLKNDESTYFWVSEDGNHYSASWCRGGYCQDTAPDIKRHHEICKKRTKSDECYLLQISKENWDFNAHKEFKGYILWDFAAHKPKDIALINKINSVNDPKVAEEKKRQEIAKKVAEEKKRQALAKKAAAEKKRQLLAKKAAEDRKRQELAKKAAEDKKRQLLAKKAAEEKKRKANEKRIAAKKTTPSDSELGALEQQLAILKKLHSNELINKRDFETKKDILLRQFLGLKSDQSAKVTSVGKKKIQSTLNKNLAKYSDVEFGKYHALVIGSNNYKYLPKLTTAETDAKSVAKTLKTKYNFKVKTLINATRQDILDSFDEYRERLTESDNLLIYYAGHGYLDEEDNQGYWLPINARSSRRSAWLSNSRITGTLKALKANHVMVVSDSCYSGTLTRGLSIKKRTPDYVREAISKKARVVITSGGLEPVADKSGGKNSPFASVFLDVLNSNNGVLDGTKMFSKMRRPVMLKAEQTPAYADVRKAGHEGGDFLFVRRR
jgi:hypothetical protein